MGQKKEAAPHVRGNIEIRFAEAGDRVDEIVLRDGEGNCVLHLESKDGGLYWMRLYGSEADLDVWFGRREGCPVNVQWDTKS